MQRDELPTAPSQSADAAHLVVTGTWEDALFARHFVLTGSATYVCGRRDHPRLRAERFARTGIQTPAGSAEDHWIEVHGAAGCRLCFEQRGATWFVVSDSSGTADVNRRTIDTEAPLRSGDRIAMGTMIFELFSGPGIEPHIDEAVRRAAIRDDLTGLYGWRHYPAALGEAISRSRAEARDLSILVIEARTFPSMPDAYDAHAEDSVEMAIARVIAARPVPGGLLARTSPLRFAFVLPETPLRGAASLGTELRLAVLEHAFRVDAHPVRVSAMAGAATLRDGDRDGNDLVARAWRSITSMKRARDLAAARAARAARTARIRP